MNEAELAIYHKNVAFRRYVRVRKIGEHNRRRSQQHRMYATFASLNERAAEKLAEEYPDFSETFERMFP